MSRHRAPGPAITPFTPLTHISSKKTAAFILSPLALTITGATPAVTAEKETASITTGPITGITETINVAKDSEIDLSMPVLTEVDPSVYIESERRRARLLAEQAARELALQEAAKPEPAKVEEVATVQPKEKGRHAAAPVEKHTAEASRPDETTEEVPVEVATASGTGAQAIEIGKKYLGAPYRYGGNDPDTGIDCSAFTRLVYSQLGVSLPRTSREQAKMGYAVSAAEAKPGDLVFMGSPVHHVGIVAGEGKILDARKTGVPVGFGSIWSDSTQYRRVL